MSERRPYNSPLRRQQAEATRERIVAAGSELVHGFERWDWRGLTVRAVARQAEVSERTVYRHFADERELRDAVMARLHDESGVALDEVTLEDFGALTARVFAYLSSFAISPRPLRDPTFAVADERRREALLDAVQPSTAGWPPEDRAIVAAVLDILWTVPTYERLRTVWDLAPDQAARAAAWFAGLVEQAIRDDRRPG